MANNQVNIVTIIELVVAVLSAVIGFFAKRGDTDNPQIE